MPIKNPISNLKFTILKQAWIPVSVLAGLAAANLLYQWKVAVFLNSVSRQNLGRIISTVFIIAICFILQKVSGAAIIWYKENIAHKTTSRLDDEMLPFLRRSLNVAIWIIAVLSVLPLYGINISGLITVFGVSSLAISLAAQDTIANIIAGFLIMVDRPFKIGDKIKLPSGEVVKVLNIGIRRSRFLLEDNAIVIMPNLDLSKNKIINYTYTINDKEKPC